MNAIPIAALPTGGPTLAREGLSAYRGHPVQLASFEGPLDLLLHLIRKDQIEIWEIEISRITHEYLHYIASWRAMEIEVAGEFLVMAATLMRMKSQLLLPRPSFVPLADEDDPPLTREQLVSRLVEYRTVREAAQSLRRREVTEGQRHARGATVQLDPDFRLPLKEPKLLDLVRSFEHVLHRKEATPGHQVQLEAFRLEDQMDWVRACVGEEQELEEIPGREERGMRFSRLLRRVDSSTETVVTLLAVLELSRLQRVRSWQERALAEIWLTAREAEVGGLPTDGGPGLEQGGQS